MNHKGDEGELLAQKALEKKGYRLIQKNYSCKMGEIDLIMMHKKRLVLVEVKARKDNAYYRPIEAINPSKLKKLYKTAQLFLMQYRGDYDSVQLDVCEVFLDHGQVEHIENVDFDISSF
jgi:putative endonuclease